MKRFSLIVAAATVLLANAVMAQPQPGGMMHRGMMMGERTGKSFAEELGLTDAQKTQINQTMLDMRKKNIDVEAKLKLAGIELHELMSADTPDQGKINAKISEVSQLREKIMRSHIETKLAIQKVLTPEQRKKAKDLRSSGFMKMRQHGGFRHFGGPGMMRRGGGFGPGDDVDMSAFEQEEF